MNHGEIVSVLWNVADLTTRTYPASLRTRQMGVTLLVT